MKKGRIALKLLGFALVMLLTLAYLGVAGLAIPAFTGLIQDYWLLTDAVASWVLYLQFLGGIILGVAMAWTGFRLIGKWSREPEEDTNEKTGN